MPELYLGNKAFHVASDFILKVYDATREFPKEETFGLTLRLRRAAIDVAASVASGISKERRGAFLSALHTSQSRLDDVSAYLGRSEELGYLSEESNHALMAECARIGMCLNALVESMTG
jgi:four helix bundle protein